MAKRQIEEPALLAMQHAPHQRNGVEIADDGDAGFQCGYQTTSLARPRNQRSEMVAPKQNRYSECVLRLLRRFSVIPALLTLSALGQGPGARVITVSIDGEISPITAEIVGHAIEQAKSESAALLLIRINTPGGLMDATRQTIQKLDASPIPVVTYVTPSGARGASAGFFVLEAGDVAAMAPGTNTGASSPVLMVGQMDQVMRDKVENDAAAMLRSMMSQARTQQRRWASRPSGKPNRSPRKRRWIKS